MVTMTVVSMMRMKVLLRNDEDEALKVMELGLKLAIEGRARLKRVSCLSIYNYNHNYNRGESQVEEGELSFHL